MDAHSEVRLVTCLFVDVVGSTDATVRLGPERMQRVLGEAFADMNATITAHGGTVEKYVGDAIFALFGAPAAHSDDVERALRAAEACVRSTATAAQTSVRLAVRIGVETGEALVDLNAVDQRQRMVVGDCVNVAARLQQHAEPGEIVVGPTCHEATGATADFEPLGTLSLKGLGEVNAWRFTGFRPGDGMEEIPFVGREAEREALRAAFEQASRGTSTLALIVGPPGQGKSRLAAEAIRAYEGARVLNARCRPDAEIGMNTPLRQLVDAAVADATPDAVRDRVSALVGSDDGARIAAAISHSAGLGADESILTLSRMEQREVIAEAWRRYLAAAATERPLLALVEDVHWADPVLIRIIDHVTSDLEAPILVIATARPEFVGSAHLRPRENLLQIDLAPLEGPAAERLAQIAGDGRAGVARAAGNPLFIIELARSRAEPSVMPVTLQAAIAARLDELAPAERELLQRASVAGETFDVRDAALLADREPGDVAGVLGRVAHLGFVVPVGSSYRFHHGLVREVAYGRLPVAERMALHARYAVEGVDPADVEAAAHHWWLALNPSDAEWVWADGAKLAAMRRKASASHLDAGKRLEERNAYEEALEVYLRALELADDPNDRASSEAAIGRAYVRQGRGDEAWGHRLRAIDAFRAAGLAPPSGLYADMLEIATLTWGYFTHLPDDTEVLRLLDEGERAARASNDDVSLARLLVERAAFTNDVSGADVIWRFLESPDAPRFADAAQRLAQNYLWHGQIARAVELYETVFHRLVPAGATINEPEAMAWYALAAFHAGDLTEATGLADRLLEEARRRSPHTRQHAYAVKTLGLFGRGDWDGVTAMALELRQLVEANPGTGFCLLGAAAAGYGAAADALAGRPLPSDLDAFAARLVEESEMIQAASVMLPKVMAGDRAGFAHGLRGYEPDLRLVDRFRFWDVCDLMPAIAHTMLEQWDDLRPSVARLEEFAVGGARLAAAAIAAIREEEAAARGGPAPAHEQLRGLGYAGISELLRFRPARVQPPA
ncbi:MAG: AAA family ATPase [Candidatus Limnocylindria bacterium]